MCVSRGSETSVHATPSAQKQRSGRNRTLTLSIPEELALKEKLLSVSAPIDFSLVCNQTIQGDTFEVLPYLPKSSIDLLIVDPPYNLSKEFHGVRFKARSMEEYEHYTRSWMERCIPLLKPNASIYVCCDWSSSLVIGKMLSEFFHIRNRITWQREKGRGAISNWKNSLEDIWYATVNKEDYVFNLENVLMRRKVIAPYKVDGKPKDWEETEAGNFRNTRPSNFWDDITIPFWSMTENTDHPTQKPEKLIAKLILASSVPGAVVLDPFLGSGTTSVVAKKLGRKFVGIEWNPTYCAWAMKRLENAVAEPGIQGYADGVFWERNTFQSQKTEPKKSVIRSELHSTQINLF
ncbi:hypothetical protein KJY77_01000 [Canibacter sp. lx-72]|uniref:DNA-methyltransferase n=1 Tax=Canibacter zhuwentaonis TaxID=2837491 RepID=UPI001BDDB5D8|nr:site-specific DNA-methyltransferase [Canibacter zhuwentaonis]MBT1017721.1 hypothetical protein [Canibacter zhuwentaonis]MBT1034875.1 hypothetical protein [Canibacter zhuwentaonis]